MKSYDQNAARFPDQKRTLVIMAKAPRPGMVKTRLSQSLPSHAVTELYCCLLRDTIALAQSLPEVEVALMCPSPDVDELSRWLGNAAQIVAQKGGGLAAGLTSVFVHFPPNTPHPPPAFPKHTPPPPAPSFSNALTTLS